MKANVVIAIVVLLSIGVITYIVLCVPCISGEQIEAIAESASAIITAASIIILVRQNRKTAIRSELALLHAERQRLESDVSQIDIARGKGKPEERRKVLADRIAEVSSHTTKLIEEHPDVFPNMALFTQPDELKKECMEKYKSCLEEVRKDQERKLGNPH